MFVKDDETRHIGELVKGIKMTGEVHLMRCQLCSPLTLDEAVERAQQFGGDQFEVRRWFKILEAAKLIAFLGDENANS